MADNLPRTSGGRFTVATDLANAGHLAHALAEAERRAEKLAEQTIRQADRCLRVHRADFYELATVMGWKPARLRSRLTRWRREHAG